ncbi:mRNA interferase RelE/StbE [Variovorax sp. HW608]|uniref:type II toxin-antitoxin system RelE family toxin n=1 Tax=Variovorax sp. HW608 TaxID=1034889 RepID=UPI00081FBA5F|nr:type II toxin-antitoxin system RelE/ParE family toxin [Variovorax sp. HW608]SCK09378.1 mRNA interferase RelE/StbE [Variovorax sp. HW608]
MRFALDVPKYQLKFLPEALEEFKALDGSIRQKFKKRLDEPHVPGSALHRDLKGAYKVKLRKEGFRLAYIVRDEELVVIVIAAGKHEDNEVYEAAAGRMSKPQTRWC